MSQDSLSIPEPPRTAPLAPDDLPACPLLMGYCEHPRAYLRLVPQPPEAPSHRLHYGGLPAVIRDAYRGKHVTTALLLLELPTATKNTVYVSMQRLVSVGAAVRLGRGAWEVKP